MKKSRNKKPIPKKYSLATKIHSGEKSPEWIFFFIMQKRKSKKKKQKGKNKKSKGLKKKNKIKN